MSDRAALRRQALHAAASVALALTAGCAGGKAPPASGSRAAAAADPAEADRQARVAAIREPHQDVCGPGGDISACCAALKPACAEAFGPEGQDYAECLWGPLDDGPRGCIPWGPPVPPAMA